MVEVKSEGIELNELLEFFESQRALGHYSLMTHEEVVQKDNKTLSADLLSILFSGGVGLVGSLILDFFQKNTKHEIVLESTNEQGQKISITLRNLSTEEVKEIYTNFHNPE